MNILKELYYGNIRPAEKAVKKDSEYAEESKRQAAAYDRLAETISEEQKDVLDELLEALNSMSSTAAAEAFTDGFKLGAALMLEINDDSPDSVFTPIV